VSGGGKMNEKETKKIGEEIKEEKRGNIHEANRNLSEHYFSKSTIYKNPNQSRKNK